MLKNILLFLVGMILMTAGLYIAAFYGVDSPSAANKGVTSFYVFPLLIGGAGALVGAVMAFIYMSRYVDQATMLNAEENILFNGDGTKLFYKNPVTGEESSYNLSTPFEIDTLTRIIEED